MSAPRLNLFQKTARILAALIFCLGAVAAHATATAWNSLPAPIFKQDGKIAAGAKAYFYSAGTSTPLTVYQDSALTTPHAFPVVAAASGVFSPIYLPYQSYRVRVTDANGALISDADGIANPAPPSSGGGGGIVVSSDMVFKTGDIKWRLSGGSEAGFVRMNLRTIGSAISGATERANADTENLFVWLWTNIPNSDAPVSGGRGASAAADWAANKTIGVPTMQGLMALGVDDMGGTAGQKIQLIKTCNVTNSSANITVSSASGLGRGMYVIINGAAAGRINSINGTTVTLDTPFAGATASGYPLRASYFPDAQTVGGVGGSQNFTATNEELPAHSHGVNDPGHQHDYLVPGASVGAQGGFITVSQPPSAGPTTSSGTGISIQSAGKGMPIQTVQPGRLGTWFMKL